MFNFCTVICDIDERELTFQANDPMTALQRVCDEYLLSFNDDPSGREAKIVAVRMQQHGSLEAWTIYVTAVFEENIQNYVICCNTEVSRQAPAPLELHYIEQKTDTYVMYEPKINSTTVRDSEGDYLFSTPNVLDGSMLNMLLEYGKTQRAKGREQGEHDAKQHLRNWLAE